MTPLNVLVVDDEPHARAGLARLVRRTAGFEVAGEVASGPEAVLAIQRGSIDLVLLDIQMPGMSGFDVLRAVGAECMPPVVFVTAYDRYAVRAFDAAAVDYLLKPFSDERFALALDRARAAITAGDSRALMRQIADVLRAHAATQATGVPNGSEPRGHFVVVERGRRSVVASDDVEWISGASYYARLHLSQRSVLIREPLHAIEKRMPPGVFLRVHRSALVRTRCIREVRRLPGGRALVVLASGARVRLSRSYRPAVAEFLRNMVR